MSRLQKPSVRDSHRPMRRELTFVDETLRDGHQSLWATRLTFKMMAPILPTLDQVGYSVLDITGSMHFEVQVRYLRENPWERIRAIKRLAPRTPLNSWMRPNNAISFEFMPEDIIELWIKCLARAGISRLTAGDPLFDMDNIRVIVEACKEHGIDFVGALQFTESPVHTDAVFSDAAQKLKEMGAAAILLKDPSALLTPERVGSLIPALRKAIGNYPLEIHSHCLTGLGPYVYFRALQLGIDGVQTATRPLANDASLPSTEQIVEFADHLGYPHALRKELLREVADYFLRLARVHRKPVGQVRSFDPGQYTHQLPGGMISNLRSQLSEIGKLDLLPEALEEAARVRKELGYINVVTPFAQMVGTQAVINVVQGSRYAMVPDEIVRYALGHYGKPLADIDSDVLDRILSSQAVQRYSTASESTASVQRARERFGRSISDEDLLLRLSIPEEYLVAMRQDLTRTELSPSIRQPLGDLLAQLRDRPGPRYVRIDDGTALITMHRGTLDEETVGRTADSKVELKSDIEFSRILIANRGEIAVRVIRTCKARGIETVLVYSDADRYSMPVSMADRAICIGPAAPAKSYLAIGSIIEAAISTGCQAVHPGYGFLAENAAFAQACEENGLVFIGPQAEAIRLMADKQAARELAQNAGVSVVPGREVLSDLQETVHAARALGFPLLLKAAQGGGGKGMRIVRQEKDLAPALAKASAEARNAFGDDKVYLEKYLDGARHIEVQVFGDGFGNTVHIWERDCSVQRRYQKVIEESPAPSLDPRVLKDGLDAAVALAQKVAYVGAGTVEFLFDPSEESFYFIEMNTRLQVEHPVTEAITGLDLVDMQLEIASGRRLSQSAHAAAREGHAIEFRITAEDPERDLMPVPGRIERLSFPSGPGIRVDTHIFEGYEVSPFYDSLLAKLVVHAANREEAIELADRSLASVVIDGIPTNLAVLRDVVGSSDYRFGAVPTQWLERFLVERRGKEEEASHD